MKAKHLLTAMVLPTLFAACTNDDFESLSQGETPAIDGRKLVENVTLDVNTGVDTRLAYNGTDYTWNGGDKIGACLMDELNAEGYHETGTTWSDWFTLVPYIQTNYKFTRGEGENAEWTTEAKLCEGNYFFVYPYAAEQGLRKAYKFSVAQQVLENTDTPTLMEAYTNNNQFVGYGKVEAGDDEGESVAVDMIPVFGTTGITIESTGTRTYTIERIVLHGTKVMNAATVNPTTCTKETQYKDVTVSDDEENYFNVAQYTGDIDEDTYNPNWTNYNSTAALRDVLDATAGNVEVIIKGGNVISGNGSINVIAMVYPEVLSAYNNSREDTQKEVFLDIYTDKGIIQNIALNKRYTKEEGQTNILTDKALEGLGNGDKVKVTFDDTAFDKPSTMPVGSEADLANLIHWNAETAASITANLTSDIHITKAIYDELAGSQITEATLAGEHAVTIDADVANDALDAFTFGTDITGVTVKGTQSMKKACGAPVTVDADATLNIDENVTLTKGITNNGTLNVNANVDAASENTTVNNYSTMNVAAGKTLADNVLVTNGGDQVPGTITNAGTIVRLGNELGTVTNNGVIGVANEMASYNKAEVYNNGSIYMKWNTGDIYANGTSNIRMEKNTSDNENNVAGNLIITDLEDDGNFLISTEGNKGNIVQAITADANTDAIDTRANTLWLSATLKMEKTDANGNYVGVNLTGSDMMNGPVKVVAKGANAKIEGEGTSAGTLRVNAIEVDKDATLVLNKIRMTVATATSVTMNGEANHVAKLTINSNASLLINGDASSEITITADENYNVLENYSSNTNIEIGAGE